MNIAIVGFDLEGRSSFEYFSNAGNDITICDQSTAVNIPDGAKAILGSTYLDNLDRFDLIVRTAGIAPSKILEKNPALSTDKITTQVNEFFRVSPTEQIIGVTGTKGKGTTSTLIAKMLSAAGFDAQLAGNIGIPALDLLPNLSDKSWAVLELSSFQLIDLRKSPPLAVCLMVAPEHLNWHASLEEYMDAKAQLFVHQSSEDLAVYFAQNEYSQQIAVSGKGHKIPYYDSPGAMVRDGVITIEGTAICRTDELKLLGAHNWQNVCAAVTAVWQITTNVEALRSVLVSFSGLEHRLEFVSSVNDVSYYDDSFGTTPETSVVAIESFQQPKVLIIGGSDKNADYTALANSVKTANVRHVLLIGEQAPRLETAFQSVGFKNFTAGGSTMLAIVQAAALIAKPGDVVLLSPACASFDMFKNYKDRAEQFQTAVQNLN